MQPHQSPPHPEAQAGRSIRSSVRVRTNKLAFYRLYEFSVAINTELHLGLAPGQNITRQKYHQPSFYLILSGYRLHFSQEPNFSGGWLQKPQFYIHFVEGFVEEPGIVKIGIAVAGQLIEQHTGFSQNYRIYFRSGHQQIGEYREHQHKNRQIGHNSWGEEASLGTLHNGVVRGMRDQLLGLAYAPHDIVTGIHAGRTVNTLQLNSVTDINSGGTNLDT